MLNKLVKGKESEDSNLKKIKEDILGLIEKVDSHATAIKKLEYLFGKISSTLNQKPLQQHNSDSSSNHSLSSYYY